MKVFKSIDEIKNIDETEVALGTFDGVHLGHRAVIGHATESAKKNGRKSAVFTFSTETRLSFRRSLGGKNSEALMDEDDKLAAFSELGVDYVFDLPFEESIMKLSPREFTEELLLKRFGMRSCFCGFNYRFGYKASGTGEVLSSLGREYGFSVKVEEALVIDGKPVSSSLIRALVLEGKTSEAVRFLGAPFSYKGKVVHGAGLGKILGYATSNISLREGLICPADGVYAAEVVLCDDSKFAAMCDIGVKPTVGSEKRGIEVHILDFGRELYGEEIRVLFHERIRDEKRFPSTEALSLQLSEDERKVRELLRSS